MVDLAPIEIWRVLSEFETISSWVPNVEHSCLLAERTSGIGTTRRVQIGRSVLVETVVEWVEPHTLSYSVEGLPPVIRSVTNTWRLEPTSGGTKVWFITDINAGQRPQQKLIAWIVGRRLGAVSDGILSGLVAHMSLAEQRP